MNLKIASYNIHKGVSAFGRKANIHGLKEAINLLDADLVFLQEVQGQHTLHEKKHAHWPNVGQHEFIAGDNHYHAYGLNASYGHGHHGNALLSRLPIASSFNHDVSDHEFEQRGNLHVVVNQDNIDIHCFVIHLGLFAVSRRRQIQALVHYIQNNIPDDSPLVIAGDFNDWNRGLSPLLKKELNVIEAFDFTSQQLIHAKPSQSIRSMMNLKPKVGYAKTFPAQLPWLCLDRVYLRGFDVRSTKVLTGSPWSKLSDHVPITVDIQLSSLL